MNLASWLFRVVVDSYRFFRFSVAQVASFYPTGEPVVLYPFGRRTIIFTRKQACHHILNDPRHQRNYQTRFGVESGLRELGMLNCGVIWNNDDKLWKCNRRSFQNGLTDSVFKDIVDQAPEHVDLVLEHVPRQADGTIHMMNALRWVTLNFTMVQLLGLERVEDWSQAMDMIEAIVAYFKAWEFFLVRPCWLLRLGNPREYRTHQDSIRKLHAISEDLVLQYERQHEQQSRSSCLSHAYSKYHSRELTREDLVQLTLEILLAGVDTSSVTMFYCLGYLAEHPQWCSEVQKEVCRASNHQDITLHSLPILQACLKESMRLKPVGPIIMRRAKDPDMVEGIAIQSGDQVILHLAAMHLYQVDKAAVFDPRRFLVSSQQGESNNSKCLRLADSLTFGFYPFGAGPKGCVGQYLAMHEMQATLRHLLRKYHVASWTRMDSMATHWDIAQQPQNIEEMHMALREIPRKVFLIGPSSTGKTTLIQRMANVMPRAKIHSEVARTIMQQQNITRDDLLSDATTAVGFQQRLVEEYAKLQWKFTNRADHYSPIEFFDRSAIDALVFCKRLGGKEAFHQLKETQEFQDCLLTYQDCQSVKIVLFSTCPEYLVDDGVRLLSSTTEDHLEEYAEYKETLKELNIPYSLLTHKSLQDRQDFLLDLISNF